MGARQVSDLLVISRDDIGALSPDDAEAVVALDRVAADMHRGVPRFTEMSADDIARVIRAGLLWQRIAIDLWQQHQERAREAMAMYHHTGRETM